MNKKNKRDFWNDLCTRITSNGINLVDGVPDRSIVRKIGVNMRWNMFKMIFDDSWRGYISSEGLNELRKLVGERIGFNSNEILITSGSQQAITLLFLILAKSKKVMVERYSYIGIEEIGKKLTLGVVNFSNNLEEMTDENIELEIKKTKPGVIYIVADFSNPKGDNLSIKKRRLLSKLSKKYGFWIIEDQAYRDLYYDVKKLKPSMSTMTDRVVVIGSMSKIMFPGLRVGWLGIKNKEVKKMLIDLKNGFDLSSSGWNQKMAIIFLKNSKILDEARSIYKERMEKLVDKLKKKNDINNFFSLRSKPEGGFYYWLNLKQPRKTEKFIEECEKRKLFLAKGSLFDYDKKTFSSGIRLSIVNVEISKIDLIIEKLFQAGAAVND